MDNAHEKRADSTKSAPHNAQPHFNSLAAQRQRLIDWLRVHGMIDTITARRELDILGVAPRVYELRHRFGHEIDTVWVQQQTDCGRVHRVGQYVLRPEGGVRHE